MKQYQYRSEVVKFDNGTLEHPISKEQKLLEILNQFGSEGWRVTGFELIPRTIPNESFVTLVLEKEVEVPTNSQGDEHMNSDIFPTHKL